jgi:hypothetical protein
MCGGMETHPKLVVNDRHHAQAIILERKVYIGQQAGKVPQNQLGYYEVEEPVLPLAGIELGLLCSRAHHLLVIPTDLSNIIHWTTLNQN